MVAKLRESGSEFRLSDNGSVVLVPSARVAELRLQMAAAGLPKSGRIGFELFDKTTFGMSDFTEQVNYHRALEGELERSVMSLAEVEQARVHITFPKESLFLDSRQPAKASVLVKLRPGAQLSPQNVAAICQLVASAVDGLLPEAVSVVDMRGNLLNRARKASSPDDPAAVRRGARIPPEAGARSARQNQQHAGTAAGRRQIPRHGVGGMRFHQRRPERGDLRSKQVGDGQFAKDRRHRAAARWLREFPARRPLCRGPPARPGAGGNTVSRRTENISYQSSHTVRHVREPQGAVKRMSVSLLVDSDVRYEGTGAKAKRDRRSSLGG